MSANVVEETQEKEQVVVPLEATEEERILGGCIERIDSGLWERGRLAADNHSCAAGLLLREILA